MKKLISFRQVKNLCWFPHDPRYTGNIVCHHKENDTLLCTKKNCPVWKKLEPSWTIAEPCRKCVHSSPDDQICEHTGWDKRTLKECPYIMEEK